MRGVARLGLVTIFAVAVPVVTAWTSSSAAGSGSRQRLLVVSFIPKKPAYQFGHVYDGHGRLLHGHTLGVGGGAVWSPNGEMVAIERSNGVWVERANGTGKRQLVSCPIECIGLSPAWTPDGRRVAVGGIDSQTTGIELVDVATGLATAIIDKAHPYDTYSPIAFSPNGRWLAYDFEGGQEGTASCCISELIVSRADGTHARVLYRFRDPIHDGPGFSTWSPDSTRIAFTDDGWLKDPRLAIVEVGTGRMHALNPHQIPDQYPAWSPNGKRLALAAGVSGAIVVATNGSGFRSLHVKATSAVLWLRNRDLLLGLGHRIELLPGGRGSPRKYIALPGHEQLLSFHVGE